MFDLSELLRSSRNFTTGFGWSDFSLIDWRKIGLAKRKFRQGGVNGRHVDKENLAESQTAGPGQPGTERRWSKMTTIYLAIESKLGAKRECVATAGNSAAR